MNEFLLTWMHAALQCSRRFVQTELSDGFSDFSGVGGMGARGRASVIDYWATDRTAIGSAAGVG
jgi:hypothetical protein